VYQQNMDTSAQSNCSSPLVLLFSTDIKFVTIFIEMCRQTFQKEHKPRSLHTLPISL